MPVNSFEIEFDLPPDYFLNIDSPQWEYRLGDDKPPIILSSYMPAKPAQKKIPIKYAKTLYLKSDGWPSKNDARKAAEKYKNALTLMLARMRMGADYKNLPPSAVFPNDSLTRIEKKRAVKSLGKSPDPRFTKRANDLLTCQYMRESLLGVINSFLRKHLKSPSHGSARSRAGKNSHWNYMAPRFFRYQTTPGSSCW